MTEITTRLTWKGNDLMAGSLCVGGIYTYGGSGWKAMLDDHPSIGPFPTEFAARAALETAAKEALPTTSEDGP